MVAQVYLYIYMYTRFFRVDLVSRLIFPGIHIGNLDAGHQGLPVGYAEGTGPRGRVVVVHSRHVLELEAKRPPGGNSALDALFGDPVYTRDAVVSRSERERRRGCEQLAVAARRSRRHTSRAPGNVFEFPCDDSYLRVGGFDSTRNDRSIVSTGDQNEHSRVTGQAVRAHVQEQRVHASFVQAHRHHVRADVLPEVFRRERVQLLRGDHIQADPGWHESSRSYHRDWLRPIIGFSVIRYDRQ